MIGIAFHLRSPVFSEKWDVLRVKTLPLFEIALVLVRFDHVASLIVNANHSIMNGYRIWRGFPKVPKLSA
jgi:hypothetical protein